ncbi:MAG TPA: CHRD domain-containing protein [Gemmataceae bacterium]|nr:CHRD domain-containing protein [Gemmataceae bacterium]
MLRLRTALLVSLVLLIASTRGTADMIFIANITTDQEVPPVGPGTTRPLLDDQNNPRPTSFGFATFVLNDARTSLTYSATVFNIDFTGTQTPNITRDNLTAAHIHAPAPPGVNAGVVFGFFGAPFNDNNPNDVVVTPFTTGVGGTITGKWDLNEGNNTTLTAQIANILAGRAYINFHTVQFPGGEIRGQIVPEPSTLTLAALGAVGLVGYRWRQRKTT